MLLDDQQRLVVERSIATAQLGTVEGLGYRNNIRRDANRIRRSNAEKVIYTKREIDLWKRLVLNHERVLDNIESEELALSKDLQLLAG